ncbi:MAG: hypothetical protein JW832_03985 [Deltaproteobacteria bacterium]|nr:hypothetical protein [Deltaproteobacteria bacterium]
MEIRIKKLAAPQPFTKHRQEPHNNYALYAAQRNNLDASTMIQEKRILLESLSVMPAASWQWHFGALKIAPGAIARPLFFSYYHLAF